MTSIYSFKVEGIRGEEIDFSAFKGKKILIVNTASECGLTPQYAQLEALHNEFNNTLVIVGFPTNNFGGQEPGTNQEIQSFCTTKFGTSFPLGAKISVLPPDQHPLYNWLTNKSENDFVDSTVEWNFQKYLLNENGQLTNVFAPSVEPLSDELLVAIKQTEENTTK